jgi:hypothetical protein
MGSSLSEFKRNATEDITLSNGLVITIRRLCMADLADIPQAWTVFNLAVAQFGGDKKFKEQWDKDFGKFGDDEENAYQLICRAAVDPKVYDPRRGDIQDDALELWAIPEVDRTRLFTHIVYLASGMNITQAQEEADRVGSFCEESRVSGGAGDGEADGDEPGAPDADSPTVADAGPDSIPALSVGHGH